jgi:hypothetical protein
LTIASTPPSHTTHTLSPPLTPHSRRSL